MSDGSWVEFVTPRRSSGLNPRARYLLTGAFVLACSFVVAALASRRLARPMERFAKHAQRFGMDVNAAPLQFSGPVEFRIAAHAFNEMQSRIQRYVVGRTELLAAISHDLRAPLTRMRLRGEFIEDEDQQRKLFRDVDEMQAMVDASLAFFRDDSEQEQTTRFKLTELVNTIVDDFRDQSYGVAFEDSPAITYVGRPMGLRRAICNLVENALKYGVCARVSIQVTVDGIEIAVEDEGPGIALHLREAVFRPFYRIESSRNRTTGGVGLGLAAARSAVRAHGGDIVLNEGTAGGLRARLLLPLA
jgi:signal transduction histidine kinase